MAGILLKIICPSKIILIPHQLGSQDLINAIANILWCKTIGRILTDPLAFEFQFLNSTQHPDTYWYQYENLFINQNHSIINTSEGSFVSCNIFANAINDIFSCYCQIQ